MKWFKMKEFGCKCCGQLPPFQEENISALVDNVLDPARERLGKPIRVNSGYRCPKHNSAVGGVRNSQHMSGEAADIVPVKSEELRVNSELARLVEIIKENGKFDQLIIYSTFVHVSWKRLGPNRLQIMRKGGA